jgi:calcineurin-like phosphoesterase family protein
MEKFYSNVFFPTLKKRGIDTVFHLGDFVEYRQHIGYVALRRTKEMFIKPSLEMGLKLHIIIGNHDVPYKSSNDINSIAELFDALDINYYSEPSVVEVDGSQILMMPWIHNQNYTECMEIMKTTSAPVVFGHFEISGCLMNRGVVNTHGLNPSDLSHFEVVCSGHFHHKSTTGNIEYLGSPFELTWADFQDPKGFHIQCSLRFIMMIVSNAVLWL